MAKIIATIPVGFIGNIVYDAESGFGEFQAWLCGWFVALSCLVIYQAAKKGKK